MVRWFALLLLFVSLLARGQEVVAPHKPISPALQARALQLVKELQLANDLLGRGDTPGALQKVNEVLQADPHFVDAYLLRGAIYNQKDMYTEAASDYEAAHLIDPHNRLILFDLAEIDFVQKRYASARPKFLALTDEPQNDIGDLALFKVFLCDLVGGNEPAAAKELDTFNQVASHPSYYFANAAWDLYHHQPDEAKSWLVSANGIYTPQKNGFYSAPLFYLGYLPLPSSESSGLTAQKPAGP